MVFSSIIFLFYFLPIALIGYYGLAFSRKGQNIWLFLISLFFYAWGEPLFVFVLLGSIIFNWLCGLWMEKQKSKIKLRKSIMIFACAGNILLLGVFKYTNSMLDIIYDMLGWKPGFEVPDIILPIGISFFTFQAMSYIIDVYRNNAKVKKNILNLGLYIAFFPKLLAGPIIQYNYIEEQLINRKTNFTLFSNGCTRFVQGIIKKVVFADKMAVIADNIFQFTQVGVDNKVVPVVLVWTGSIAYCLQLYYDFSGYSDMAIGLGKMFGFEFEENFDHPFTAKSLKCFMSKWHISLSKWFDQYVYRPLGGSKVRNEDLMVRNLLIVWLCTGIWHGVSWTYILWGLGFFVLILIEKVTGWEAWKVPSVIKHFLTVFWVVILFTLFRSESIAQFFEILMNMFCLNQNGFFSDTALMIWKEYSIEFILGIVFLMPIRLAFEKKISEKNTPMILKILGGTMYVLVLIALFAYCVIEIAQGGSEPFIYFNF